MAVKTFVRTEPSPALAPPKRDRGIAGWIAGNNPVVKN